ncbi:MAG: hypothetical protein ABH834_07295 [Candidatus Altiarchaeota archaeon]
MEKRGYIVFLVVLLFVFSLGFFMFHGADASAEEIKAGVLAAVDGVDTYRFSTDVKVGVDGQVEGVSVSKLDVIEGSGAVDVSGRRMLFDVNVKSTPSVGGVGQSMKVYFVGDRVFFQSGDSIVVESISDSDVIWGERTQLKQQAQILSRSSVRLVGEESVDGVDAYVLELSPGREDLVRYIAGQASVGGAPLEVSDSRVSDLTGMVDETSISMWVGKADFLPVKFRLYMRLSSGDIVRVTDIVMYTWGYGENVDIVSPSIS